MSNKTNTTDLTAQRLAEILFDEMALDSQAPFFVALSGGVDSSVLLHLMATIARQQPISLTALHVDHQLQACSAQWAEHCIKQCEQLGVSLKHTKVELKTQSGGLEANAREARYRWFNLQLTGNAGILLTAHHQQDRAETVLFNLMRGAGSSGLSSMRALRPLISYSADDETNIDAIVGASAQGKYLKQEQHLCARPLLGFTQQKIVQYAEQNQLSWVEDPSNQSVDFSRNFIRHNIIPQMQELRSDAVKNIVRSAENLQKEHQLLTELAQDDLAQIRCLEFYPLDQSHAISLSALAALSPLRQSNVLRYWLNKQQLHTPSTALLDKLLAGIKQPPSNTAILQEQGWQFRFFQDYLYVMPAVMPAMVPTVMQAQDFSIAWHKPEQSLPVESLKAQIKAKPALLELLNRYEQGKLVLRTRQTGEVLKNTQGRTVKMKKCLQELHIPPWRRYLLPMLVLETSLGEILITVVDGVCENEWVESI